jgi:ectoine hydroxylase-related dioxygenase (phytanoyl-CoA dioxygenase family)
MWFSFIWLEKGCIVEVKGQSRTMNVYPSDSNDIVDTYSAEGVVLLSDVFTMAETEDIRRQIHRYEKWLLPAVPDDWVRREIDGSVRGMYWMEQVDPFFAAFGARDDLGQIVERVTGESAVFKAGIETFHKQPLVGSPSLVHQDGIYYEGTNIRGVNVWIAIDEATAENAALHYWPGSHKHGLIEHGSVEGDQYFRAISPHLVEDLGPPMLAELKPGSIAIHHDKMVHGSPGNSSEHARLSLVLTFELQG